MTRDAEKARLRRRVGGAALALAAFSMLAVGYRLDPSPAGHGTHTQLGFTECPWVIVLHMPCPTCGMTTAVSHAAHGHLWASFRVQPFGALIALSAAGAIFLGLHAAVMGSRAVAALEFLTRPRALWLLSGLVLAAWGYKWLTWVTP